MEKKFYPDNFEQLLKESADNFRMYPSKRVWHSIYNDLHPSRKWPSLAIWLLLISSIIYIGLSNRNNTSPADNNSQFVASATKGPNTVLPLQNLNSTNLNNVQEKSITQNLNNTGSTTGNKDLATTTRNNNKNIVTTNSPRGQEENTKQFIGVTALNTKITSAATSVVTDAANVNDKDLFSETFNTTGINAEPQKQAVSSFNNIADDQKEKTNLDLIVKKSAPATEKKLPVKGKNNANTDKEWIEDYAFHNKPTVSKWKSRTMYQFDFTPSIGYRTLAKNSEYNPVASLVAPSINVQDYKESISHVAEINMEIGANILYNLTKRWNLKVGLQFNYTNYGINAYELKHPTMTSLMLNDLTSGLPVFEPRPTTLANTNGVTSKRLNNNTFQISLPLGADVRLAGRNNLKWYAGATIQPTYVIGGHAYLISADLKNYVIDNSFMNKWNMNASVETFISYKTKSGIVINVGPQFRYQLFSTYSRKYTYSEKLYNVGLKLGITTKL